MPRNAPIDGLLIEGVDYAGKTAVTDALERLMTALGWKTVRRACFISQHPIIDALLAQAKASGAMDQRDVFYTSSLLIDLSVPPLPLPNGYLLQERHALTQIGRNTFFYDDPVRWQVETIENLRRPFTAQAYLTSDIVTKRTRTRTRPPKSPRDALLAGDPVLHQRYDDYMRDSLPKDEDWLILDTSHLNVDGVALRLWDYLCTTDERFRHAPP